MAKVAKVLHGAVGAIYSKTAFVTFQQLKMEGFLVFRWFDQWNEGIEYMAKLIQEGKLKVKETMVQGFENMPEAFIGLFTGTNTGKMVIKV